ncbi:Tyrosyl-tRNA synthetase [Hordeum vulgare]|nr:Tyrosyl-tRNA synthetase [Hordeum vulgare]
MLHLCRQEPQEKLPKLKSVTSTSYYDFDIEFQISFYGTQDPEEYLEWERKMGTYLKLLQVPSEDQVKCATRNLHDYASTWWLHTPSKCFEMSWSKTKKAMRQDFVPSTYMEHLQRHLENTIQGLKPLNEYFVEMKKALRLAGVAESIWIKFYFMIGLNNDIAKTIFTNTYKSLDDLYFGALKAEQDLKAKATRPHAHFATTKLDENEHEDDTTKMSNSYDAPKRHDDDHDYGDNQGTCLDASDKVASKDDASILGGESDDVQSSTFIHDDGDDIVEREIFPSTMAAFGDEWSDLCHHIESESDYTTSPICDELPHLPCEDSHNPTT